MLNFSVDTNSTLALRTTLSSRVWRASSKSFSLSSPKKTWAKPLLFSLDVALLEGLCNLKKEFFFSPQVKKLEGSLSFVRDNSTKFSRRMDFPSSSCIASQEETRKL